MRKIIKSVMSLDEYHALHSAERKRSKMGNVQTFYAGRWFASAGEAARYAELEALLNAGVITDLKCQTAFTIVPKTIDKWTGKKYAARKYVVDYTYKEGGRLIAEDFKGYETPMFRLKRQLFLLAYPDIELRITKRSKS
jgi:hypothetical protein